MILGSGKLTEQRCHTWWAPKPAGDPRTRFLTGWGRFGSNHHKTRTLVLLPHQNICILIEKKLSGNIKGTDWQIDLAHSTMLSWTGFGLGHSLLPRAPACKCIRNWASAEMSTDSTHAAEPEREGTRLQPLDNYCQSKQNKALICFIFHLSLSVHHESMIHDWEVTKLTGGEKCQQWVDWPWVEEGGL